MTGAMNPDETLLAVTQQLLHVTEPEQAMGLRHNGVMPSVEAIREMMTLITGVIFPGFFDRETVTARMRQYRIGMDVERIYGILKQQIGRAVVFCEHCDAAKSQAAAHDMAVRFVALLPEVRRLLLTDVEAMAQSDPAVASHVEVVYSYPVVRVMTHYRVAHALHTLGVPLIARIITEMAHSDTGIDIHPGAQIGEYFSIDHGTGVVIGATTIIGNHVALYQGVTLGARNFVRDENGVPVDVPRHPILEDRVVVYSNASILGRIRIGHDSVIGGNVWVTHDVPPHSRVQQGKLIELPHFTDGAGI